MSDYDFWTKWEDKTEIEETAIQKVILAMKKVLASISKDQLIAIYIKGSFARREMKEGSDVDMVPIVAENEDESAVFGVNGPDIEPVMVVPLSLWELKHNKLWTKTDFMPDLRAEPDLFLKKLQEYKLIYGSPLNVSEFPKRERIQIIKDEIAKIKYGYIPAFLQGKISFKALLKEVFWLVEIIQETKGKKVKHSFTDIAESAEKNHIIKAAYELLFDKKLSQEHEKSFISDLQEYLKNLEREFKD